MNSSKTTQVLTQIIIRSLKLCRYEIPQFMHISSKSYCSVPNHVGKNNHFREINISTKIPEFVISVGNLWISAMNDKILKNVINIRWNSQYLQWPLNGEPSNNIWNNRIVLSHFQKGLFLFHSKKDCSFLAQLWVV